MPAEAARGALAPLSAIRRREGEPWYAYPRRPRHVGVRVVRARARDERLIARVRRQGEQGPRERERSERESGRRSGAR